MLSYALFVGDGENEERCGKWQGEGVKAVICLLQVSPAVRGALLFDVGLQGKSCSRFR